MIYFVQLKRAVARYLTLENPISWPDFQYSRTNLKWSLTRSCDLESIDSLKISPMIAISMLSNTIITTYTETI